MAWMWILVLIGSLLVMLMFKKDPMMYDISYEFFYEHIYGSNKSWLILVYQNSCEKSKGAVMNFHRAAEELKKGTILMGTVNYSRDQRFKEIFNLDTLPKLFGYKNHSIFNYIKELNWKEIAVYSFPLNNQLNEGKEINYIPIQYHRIVNIFGRPLKVFFSFPDFIGLDWLNPLVKSILPWIFLFIIGNIVMYFLFREKSDNTAGKESATTIAETLVRTKEI